MIFPSFWSVYSRLPFCYPSIVRSCLKDCDSILDLGCGNVPLSEKLGLSFDRSVGVEVVPRIAREADRFLDRVYVDNILDVDFDSGSFDAVVGVDVIEHFEKDVAFDVISRMKDWCKRFVVVVTPNVWSPGYFHGPLRDDLRVFQDHKCLFGPADLSGIGFDVYGIRGVRYVKLDYRNVFPFLKLFSLVFQPFVVSRPCFASGLLGIYEA